MTQEESRAFRNRNRIVLLILAINVAAIVGSIVGGYQRGQVTYHFKEREAVTFLSALQMGMTAVAAFLLYSLRRRHGDARTSRFWLISGIGFLWLTADEWFLIHEGIDDGILGALGYVPEGRHFLFDWMVIAAYGVAALFVSIRYRTETLATANRAALIVVAAVFFVLQTGADAFEAGSFLTVFEEATKLMSVGFFFSFFVLSFLEESSAQEPVVREQPAPGGAIAHAIHR